MRLVPLTPSSHVSLRSPLPSIAAAAMLEDELFAYVCPHRHTYPDAFRSHFARSVQMRLNSPWNVVVVAVKDNDEKEGEEGCVMGYAIWERRGRGKQLVNVDGEGMWWEGDSWRKWFERLALRLQNAYVSLFRLDPSVSRSALADKDAEFAGRGSPFDEYMCDEEEGSIWLSWLAVDPAWQKRGVGKRLVRWGTERADQEGLKVALVASQVGLRLYQSVGFRVVGMSVVGEAEGSCMVRWPGGERD